MDEFRKEFYARYVTTFKTLRREASAAEIEKYRRWCTYKYLPHLKNLPKDAPILEVGCGSGDMLEFLAASGFTDATGIDVSAEQVAVAQSRGLKATHADMFEFMKQSPRKYSAIVAIDVAEHLTREEVLNFFLQVNGILEPEGTLLIQTANGQGLFAGHVIYGDLTHFTIFNLNSMKQIQTLCGFEQIQFFETGPIPEGAKGKSQLLLWQGVKFGANLIRRIEEGAYMKQDVWTQNMICVSRKPAARAQ